MRVLGVVCSATGHGEICPGRYVASAHAGHARNPIPNAFYADDQCVADGRAVVRTYSLTEKKRTKAIEFSRRFTVREREREKYKHRETRNYNNTRVLTVIYDIARYYL